MKKKTFLVLICLMSLIICISTLHGQGSKKTMTLPNGEVIHDLNGEWDGIGEGYGTWKTYGTNRGIVKITQPGSSFLGIRMTDIPALFLKGTDAVRGELDKNGFKKVQLISGAGPVDCKGKISEDGNKMVIDDGEKIRATYTRK